MSSVRTSLSPRPHPFSNRFRLPRLMDPPAHFCSFRITSHPCSSLWLGARPIFRFRKTLPLRPFARFPTWRLPHPLGAHSVRPPSHQARSHISCGLTSSSFNSQIRNTCTDVQTPRRLALRHEAPLRRATLANHHQAEPARLRQRADVRKCQTMTMEMVSKTVSQLFWLFDCNGNFTLGKFRVSQLLNSPPTASGRLSNRAFTRRSKSAKRALLS